MATRTGSFPIGFRLGWTEWQKDLPALAKWAKDAGFEALDLGRADAESAGLLNSLGLRLGSVDLVGFGGILSDDPGKRRDAIAQNVAYVNEAAQLGAKEFFTCIIPGNAEAKRSENYALAVDSFGPIIEAAAAVNAHVVIEGYPAGWPYFHALCCTPETYRSFIKDTGGKGVGVNYDPSHLIRLGVDHIRFLKEFAPYVYHVHAKDTEVDKEALYEFGLFQSGVFTPEHGFGANAWRYTLPGHGEARWTEIFTILTNSGYKGAVSVELEDENFNGTEEGEKAGLVHSLEFLRGA